MYSTNKYTGLLSINQGIISSKTKRKFANNSSGGGRAYTQSSYSKRCYSSYSLSSPRSASIWGGYLGWAYALPKAGSRSLCHRADKSLCRRQYAAALPPYGVVGSRPSTRAQSPSAFGCGYFIASGDSCSNKSYNKYTKYKKPSAQLSRVRKCSLNKSRR